MRPLARFFFLGLPGRYGSAGLLPFAVVVAALLLAPRAFATTHPSVAVAVLPGAPEIDPSALRDAASKELDAPVLEGLDAPGAAVTLVVSVDRARGELVVERRDTNGGISRRVPLPATREETLRAAVFLIGNLARDEAADLVRELHPSPSSSSPPAAPPSPSPAPPPPPPAPPAPPMGDDDEEAAPDANANSSAKGSYWLGDAWRLRPSQLQTPPRFWIGASLSFDLDAVSSTSAACAGGGSYTCYQGDAEVIAPSGSASGRIGAGLAFGNIRSLVSFDVAATRNLLFGVRFGNSFGASPGNQGNVLGTFHFEARATYVIGDRPLVRAGWAQYVFVAGGASQYAASAGVTFVDQANGQSTPVSATAWKVGGPAFASTGAGARWAITPRFALTFGPRFNVAFGNDAPMFSITQELGVAYGI